jgi:hypothetical protein
MHVKSLPFPINNVTHMYTKSNYAFVSLIVLLFLLPMSGISREMPKHRAANWIQKMQIAEKFNRMDASGISIQSDKPRLHRQVLQVWNESEWVDNEETRYTYNGEYPATETISSWNGSEWMPARKITFMKGDYDQIETIIEESYAGNGQYEPAERYRLIYGYSWSSGELTLFHIEYDVWMGSDWEKVSRDSFDYTFIEDDFYMTGWTGAHHDGNTWVQDQKYEMTVYGEDLKQTDYMWTGEWTPVARTIYMDTRMADMAEISARIEEQASTYLSLPLLMAELPDFYEQELQDNIWVFVSRTERYVTYDWSNGQMLQQKIEILEWDHHLWIPQTAYVIDYDENVKPFRAGIDFPMEEEFYRFTEDVFEYNDRGLLNAASLSINSGEELSNIFKRVYVWDGTGTSIGDGPELPDSFNLGNAYPNPFNPTTVIPYETGVAGQVTIRVYDILGRLVSTLYNGPQSAGKHQVRFDAAGLTSGKYLVRMEAPGYSQTRAITLLK